MILTKKNNKPQRDPNGAGWPSKTGNNFGKGRGNNINLEINNIYGKF